MKLTQEEKEILTAYENGELKSVPDVKDEINRYNRYAKNTLLKNKRINIRISEWDMVHIQRKATEEGIPYQTLISSLIHKHATK